MKLILAFIAAIRGDDDYTYDDISIDDLMSMGDPLSKWGQTQRCIKPSTANGSWSCKNAKAPVYGRKRREDDENDIGRWGYNPQVDVMVCKIHCHSGYELVGTEMAVCQYDTGHWRKPVNAVCKKIRPQCRDITATIGTFKCHGSVYDRVCQLHCPAGYTEGSLGSYYQCIDGKWPRFTDCIAKNFCAMPRQKPIEWRGKYVCKRKQCETGAPNSAGFASGRKRRSLDGKFNDADIQDLEVGDRGLFDDLNLDEVSRWGAPNNNECIVCYLNCDPIHQAKSGFRAQCRITDGVWFEPMNPKCHFGHKCYWPSAGPMGEYNCESNLFDLGYRGEEWDIVYEPMKGSPEHQNGDWQKKQASKPRNKRESEGLGPRWFPPPVYTTQAPTPPPTPPPTRPPPAPTIKPTPAPWWGAEWTCTINCARWHYPKNGRATATCLLRNSQWTGTATECVYKSPCSGTPRTSNGVGGFQCWEATTVNTGGNIVKRSADNSTDTDFTPSPLGRWGAPTGKPIVDKTNWDFNVQKVCLLACPDCYNPSQHKSICINGEWQKGYGGDTHGRCVMEERCPDRPWWPIGNGQWTCNSFSNKIRSCSLGCDPFHIVQPYAKPLPVPPTLDPAKIYKNTAKKPNKINPAQPPTCQPKMPIPNGWMECHVGKAIQNCMIMCNQGMRPTSQKLYAVCKNGMMFPGTPQKDTRWGCVSGHCDHSTFGQACYDHPQNGRKRRSVESFNDNMLASVASGDSNINNIHDAKNSYNDDMLSKVSVKPDYTLPDNQFADDDDSGAIARWGVSVSHSATCDNCDGYWKNQIKCVFNTKCSRPRPPANGSIQCARDPKGAMTHRCNVQCQKDYKLWPPGCSMSCDPHGGVWSKCTCEWNKKCDVPVRPNAQYYCETKNGIFECALVCKGNGQYVPAVWPDIWKFQCKRGDWIERNPQGCKYEPPCVPPKVPNAYLKNCRTERCLAPRRVYEELMPGQYNYQLTATQQGMAGSTQNAAAQMMAAMGMGSNHVGYTGRKRRATAMGFFEGETYQTDDRYVVNDDDEDAADRWGGGGNLFGVCPLRRNVNGGVIHCHTVVTETVNGAAIIGHDAQLMSSGTTGVVVPEYTGGEVENPGRCQQRHMIHNGWMECKPSSNGNWICMIMCNDLHRPTSTNLYANCSGGHIAGNWSCVPGSCNPNVYQEACWNPAHPGNPPVNPISGGGSSPPAIIPSPGGNVQNPGHCQERHMIENGWMECKPSSNGSSSWVCMIMCNNMTRPTSTNLYANCNGGHIPGSWMCVPGSCNPSIYKEACYNPSHPGNPPSAHGRKRRELDYNKIVDYVNYKPDEEVEPPIDEESLDRQESMAEEWELAVPTTDEDLRWFPPPTPPPTPPPPIVIEVAMCSLRCNYGYMIDPTCKQTSFECDTMTGVFTPSTSQCGCVPKPTPKPTEVMVWAKCMCCDVKCPQWYRGGGVAKCTKGYWWKIDSCTKYNMCKQPGNPTNGEYNCYWSDTGPTGRKRRAITAGKEWNGPVDRESIDYDRSDPEEERTLDDGQAALMYAGTPDSVAALRNHPGTNGTVERLPEEIDGLRWASVPTQPQLICNLKCKEGFIPKRRQAVCVDSQWLSKPTVCVKDPHYDPWTPPKCQCKLPKHANKDPSGKWHCKTLMLDPNSRSVEADMKLAEADGYSLITEESTMEGLIEENNFMERWHTNKQKLKPYLVCKLKCAKDHNVKGGQIAKCDMKTGSWVQQASGKCVAKPWDPTDSKCHCPKGKVKNGAWKCKTVLSSEFRSEDYSEDEGYTVITEKSTISELMTDSGVAERWHQEPKKQLVMVCRLDCDKGYSAAGSKKASCVLKTNSWYGDFDGYCKKNPEPNKCVVPTKASHGDWYCTYDMLHDDRSENNQIPEDEFLEMGDGITLDDVDRHKKKKKQNYDCHHCGIKHLVCVLRCNNKYEAHPSEVAKCNTQTGHWVQKQGKCRPKWEPKCDIPSTEKGGYWNCATMLTDPKAPREVALPELHDVTGLTTADLVSRNVGMTERWYAEPELEYMLVCQLTCNSQHRPHGHDVIKCNLDTGFWNKPTPECIANTPVDPWDPYKHGKCKVPKSHGVGTWSCKTKMYTHDRTDEFEDDGEGYIVISEDTTMTELLNASGVGSEYNRQNQERWYEPPKQKVYLVCKLDCPWGYDEYGNTTVKCNCRDGWPKKPKFGTCKVQTTTSTTTTTTTTAWHPGKTKCHCPKQRVQNGSWHCKTTLKSDMREVDTDEGYLLIEEESTIDDLLDAGIGERWHQEPTKQLVMVCKLKCNSGYKAMGDRTASCVLRTNEWYGEFDNAWCEEEEMDEGDFGKCDLPSVVNNGKLKCCAHIGDGSRVINPSQSDYLEVEERTKLVDLINKGKFKKPKPHQIANLICNLTCASGFEAQLDNISKCNAKTGQWENPVNKCVSTWRPKCEMPAVVPGGELWKCTTQLTDPYSEDRSEFEGIDEDFVEVTEGFTVEDLVERKKNHKNKYVAEPELVYMLVCNISCMDKHNIYGYETIKCDLDKGFWNKPTPQCIPQPTKPPKTKAPTTKPPQTTPVQEWHPMKHNKCKPPKPPAVGHWSCKTQMFSDDRSESFESSVNHEGFYVVNDSMRTEDLMEISGVVQRWKQKNDGDIYLVCKLECPWGSKRYGAAIVKCNCEKGGFDKQLGMCKKEGKTIEEIKNEKLAVLQETDDDIDIYDDVGESQGKIYDDYWGDTGLSAMANGAEYTDPSNSLSALVNESTASPTTPPTVSITKTPNRVVENEKGGKKKKKDKKKKVSGGSSSDNCDSACKKKLKKIKKIEKKCKVNPKLNVCKKLPALKGDLGSRNGLNDDRNASFEVIDPDFIYPNFDEKCEEMENPKKCHKIEWRNFCILNPSNVFCN